MPELQDAIDANMKVAKEDQGLQCWFFAKPYANMFLMRDGTRWTRTQELEIRRTTVVR